jgi:hypothetical protein
VKKYFELNGRRVEVKKAVSKNEMPYGAPGNRGFGEDKIKWSFSVWFWRRHRTYIV